MKLNFPGLIVEPLPSGNKRYRVRVRGKPGKRITLSIDPEHKDFGEAYLAARAGKEFEASRKPADLTVKHSVAWLTHRYLDYLSGQVEAGQASPATLSQRKHFFAELRADCGEYDMAIPTRHLVEIRNAMAKTPGKADNFVAAVRSMYQWATSIGLCDANPAVGIGRIHKGYGGATSWTPDDLRRYRDRWPFGTREHLALTLFMFTACRISDGVRLGRRHEIQRDGMTWIAWQPAKKNSPPVEIPMAPPLERAIRAQTVVGESYLLTQYGRPFSSPTSFGNKFREWCRAAGLENRSAHGIRKAAGNLLAEEGATQYEIMSIHGHLQAKTSEVYTRSVERRKLARAAMDQLAGMEW